MARENFLNIFTPAASLSHLLQLLYFRNGVNRQFEHFLTEEVAKDWITTVPVPLFVPCAAATDQGPELVAQTPSNSFPRPTSPTMSVQSSVRMSFGFLVDFEDPACSSADEHCSDMSSTSSSEEEED